MSAPSSTGRDDLISGDGVTHAVVVFLNDQATPEKVDELTTALRELSTTLSGLRFYRVGRDLGLNPGNPHSADLAVIAAFADQESYLAYRDHPRHQEIITTMLAPITDYRRQAQLAG